MRHLYSGRKLKRTPSHRKALLSNMATSLLEHKRVSTTEAKAKELRPFVEKLITRAKNAFIKEQNNQLASGQTVDVHARRVVGKIIRQKPIVQELFDSIAPVVETRNGGYTRIIKTGQRNGDGARTAIIELVDFHTERDGATSLKRRRRSASNTKNVVSKSSAQTAIPTQAELSHKALQETLMDSMATTMQALETHAVADDVAEVVVLDEISVVEPTELANSTNVEENKTE